MVRRDFKFGVLDEGMSPEVGTAESAVPGVLVRRVRCLCAMHSATVGTAHKQLAPTHLVNAHPAAACLDVAEAEAQAGRAAVIVTILCDSADKYLSERFWSEPTEEAAAADAVDTPEYAGQHP